MKKSVLEEKFLLAWTSEFPSLPIPEQQYRHHPVRRWRWDFALPDQKILIDIQGGTFCRGGHSRGMGQDKDYEKWNSAVRMGFRPFLFGTQAMKDPIEVVTFIAEVYCDV